MDKRSILDAAARSSEERVLLGHIWDRWQQAQQRNMPTATAFLTPNEQAAAQRLLQSAGAGDVLPFGGYEGAERCQLHFLPDWQETPEESAIAALRCRYYRGDKAPTHRDLLGSLMGLGVKRSSIGDILVSPDSADILLSAEVADFVQEQWTSAGRTPLQIERIALEELRIPEIACREIRDTVASLRLDSVVATAFRTSRAKAAEAICTGKVEVNWLACEKADRVVETGDIITLRGGGKCRLDSVGNPTRKGRLPICVKKYI